jgi:hypothetical protein
MIVPLVYRPTVKTAMLAAPFASALVQLLGTFVNLILARLKAQPGVKAAGFAVAGVVVQQLSTDEGEEASQTCTMIMETLVVLFNHEVCLYCGICRWHAGPVVLLRFLSLQVCLDPLLNQAKRQVENMPTVREVCSDVCKPSTRSTVSCHPPRLHDQHMQAISVAKSLLELLPGMGTNATLAHRVLRLMLTAGKLFI